LTARPRINVVLYHGILASRAKHHASRVVGTGDPRAASSAVLFSTIEADDFPSF
jgi:hypothetical protein